MYSNPCAASLSATKPLTTLSVVSVINVIATNTFPFGGVIADTVLLKTLPSCPNPYSTALSFYPIVFFG